MHAENEVVPVLMRHFKSEMNRGGWDGAPLSSELVDIIQTYADLHEELKDVRNQLQDLNRQIDSAEALSLWDSVTE